MKFAESTEYLFSLGNEVSAMKLGLENIRKLLAALGNPENNYLKVQVAGTNGKGSVCAFLDSICNTAGIKTGTFTSPHLVSITERIRINGSDISEDDFASHATFVRETAENLLANGELEYRPTFFEQITAIALVAFADAKVEVAILETGLGGRLDATTAANAEIAAITQIDYDHQEYLGETLTEIAAEKAAVVHIGSRVVVGEQQIEALQVVLDRCESVGTKPLLTWQYMPIEGGNLSGNEGVSSFGGADRTGKDSVAKVDWTHSLPVVFPPLGLPGRHQIGNARIAILVAEILKDYFQITNQNVIDGLKTARHPGRLEVHGQYLLDGAHNVGGARALGEFIDEFVDKPITLIFGVMKEKDVAEILDILLPRADRLILTKPTNLRAMTATQIAAFVPNNFDIEKITLTDTVAEAIETANEVVGENGTILITGSLYLVGEAKKILKANLPI